MIVPRETPVVPPTDPAGKPIIEVRNLVKRYGDLAAVNDVDLDVFPAEIFGIVGPNGAGKTTTLEMIESLRVPDSGSISVAGIDALRDPDGVKRRIGIQLQTTALFEFLTVRELVALFGALYKADTSDAWIDQVIGMVSLEEKADNTADTLSGGQQQRLSIALALVNDPDIVFLDEPTTGLDPQARRNLWDVVQQIRSGGKTVVLTTHYMEEAEILCDRVAVMDHGRIILCDTPARLIDTLDVRGAITAEFGTEAPSLDDLRALPDAVEVSLEDGRATIQTSGLQRTMAGLIAMTERNRIHLDNLTTRRPTLEDVFLHYTGRSLRE